MLGYRHLEARFLWKNEHFRRESLAMRGVIHGGRDLFLFWFGR